MKLPKPLIRPAELASLLSDPAIVIVDCRHQLLEPGAGERSFVEGHIPGARHAHLDRDLSREPTPEEGRHPLPSPRAFAMTLESLGISNDSAVVVYDDSGSTIAARLWWMLRWVGHQDVSVLDGGMAAWSAAGLPVETGPASGPPGRYRVGDVHADWVVDTSALQDLLRTGCGVLLDARTAERFEGRAEPIDPVAGHIPGAVNLPGPRLQTREGQLESASILRARFAEVLAGRSATEVVAMCGSGVTACHLLLAMEAAGLNGGRLYAGSWSEWIRDPARPTASKSTD
jgi:thiosulfate/3-mercaptopyruvate sulfurtransferase